MTVKKAFKFITIIILLILIVINIQGVSWSSSSEGVGFGFLKEDGETVQYCYINNIINLSIFPKTVTFEAFSYEDAEISFIKEPELKVVSVGICDEENLKNQQDMYYLLGNTMTLQPFTEYMIHIECEGEYGGKGNGVRHPPDTVKIK